MTQARLLSSLPPPRLTGKRSLDRLLTRRRSVRTFADVPVARMTCRSYCGCGDN
jgi:hypothetical protein